MAKLNFEKIVKRVVDRAPGLIVGAAASNALGTAVTKWSGGKAAPMVVAGAQIVAGALVPAFLGSGKKAGFIEAVADGIMAQGSVQLAKALNIPFMNGTDEDTLAGAEEDYMNYEESSSTLAGNEA